MRITGYSERGAVNSLLYEFAYSEKSLQLLEEFLSLTNRPVIAQLGSGLTDAHIFVEQSLSDFGDADAILLLSASEAKAVVFLEAKVKSSQRKKWTLDEEFNDFKQGCHTERKLNSSNLFTQLYHKNRFIDGLTRSGGIKSLQRGIDFPVCSTKSPRKIGNNPVVLNAVKMIEVYAESAWYFSLVPDETLAVRSFFDKFAEVAWPPSFNGIEPSRWGGISWEQVVEFCNSFNLQCTRQVLDFNKKQLYE